MEYNLEKIYIQKNNCHLLTDFLQTIEKSKNTFKYFEKRNMSVIEQHIATLIFKNKKQIVGYSHLEKEKNIVWLGICVSDAYHGMGIGKKIMLETIKEAKMNKINFIHLSVYKTNAIAYNLYKKLDFKIYKEDKKTFYMKKEV